MAAAKECFSRSGRRGFYTPAQFALRNDYPYGVWYCKGGRTVLFNRFYDPIFQKVGDGPVEPADGREWVEGIEKQYWFYDDGFSESRRGRVARQALGAFQSGQPLRTLPGTGRY
jgi:hypothetical protein